MKHGLEQALAEPKPAADEPEEEHRHARHLDEQGYAGDLGDKAQGVAGRIHVAQLLAHGEQVPESHPAPHQHRADGGERHDPQTPDLDEEHDHHDPEGREGGREGNR